MIQSRIIQELTKQSSMVKPVYHWARNKSLIKGTIPANQMVILASEACLNIEMSSHQYRNSHHKTRQSRDSLISVVEIFILRKTLFVLRRSPLAFGRYGWLELINAVSHWLGANLNSALYLFQKIYRTLVKMQQPNDFSFSNCVEILSIFPTCNKLTIPIYAR